MTQHRFQPSRWATVFGFQEPEIEVESGDTVETRTVDSDGYDADGTRVIEADNPLTGPFAVRGAEPGDSLEVTLLDLRPNRDTAWSESTLWDSMLVDALSPEAPERASWHVDREREVAWPIDELNPAEIELSHPMPLQPMLGCLGVAPGVDHSESSATAGRHGGNLDFPGLRAGATLCFPVTVPGALLFLGDGHLLQGDGEILGSGLECSLDVAFRVDVRSGSSLRWPRGWDAERFFVLTTGPTVEHGLREATAEMLAWLEQDFSLSARQARLLLGMDGRFVVGSVVNPVVTVGCWVKRG